MYENDGGLLSPRDAYRLMLKDYPDVMDIGQMCEALGVSTKTGYKLLKDGKIEYLKIGRAYRIPRLWAFTYSLVAAIASLMVSPFKERSQ